MFFDINTVPLANFHCCYALGNLFVNTDSGWTHKTIADHDVVYKGYMDAASLECSLDEIISSTEPLYTGNFCVIAYNRKNQIFSIKSDRWRSFPIYLDVHQSINNLVPKAWTAWADSLISFDDGFNIQEHKFDVIGPAFASRCDTDSIRQHLLDKIQRFYNHNPGPIKIFLSGGVDTMLVYSCVLALGIPHEVIWSTHIDHDWFWLQNHRDIQQHWAYQQIHHWTEPCVLASGAPGDEFMMRSPTTANFWLLNRGSSILQELQPQDLHWHYFNKAKHLDLFRQQQQEFAPATDTTFQILNTVLNDWQHWHLGNTLTWTPLRDLDLAKMMLCLDPAQIIQQICSSKVSIDIIELNQPGLSAGISDQKNSGNCLANLTKLSAFAQSHKRSCSSGQ
jgi:hypothetical protein